MTNKIHLAVGLLFNALQLMIKKAKNAPSIAIREVEAPTEKESVTKEENRIPPIPPKTQIYIILSYPTIDSNIVPKISAKIVFENI